MHKKFHLASYITVMSLSYLALGVTLPSISLIVVSKGYSLQNLSLAILCMSVSVIAFEIPSGMLCDMKGRRLSYQFGLLLNLVGTVLFFNASFLVLCFSFSLTGVGRAFTSGSLDAMMIEEGQKAGKNLEDIVFALEVSSSLCLALGSFLGGFLLSKAPQGEQLVQYVLIARFMFLVLAFVMTWPLIPKDTASTVKQSFVKQLKDLVGMGKKNPFLVYYLGTVLLEGVLLASVEGYWQPYLKTLLVSSHLWVLGLVAGSVFATSILGSYIAKFLISHLTPKPFYVVTVLVVFALLGIMGLRQNLVWFLLIYELIYLVLGIQVVVGQYLLNANLENSVRSSFLSMKSFSLQIGGVFSGSLAVWLLSFLSIPLYWVLVAAIGVFVLLLLLKGLLQRSPRS